MRFFQWLVSQAFPPKCMFCGKVIDPDETLGFSRVCAACSERFIGRSGDATFPCKLPAASFLVAPLSYAEQPVASALRAYKFYHKKVYGIAFGEIVAKTIWQNKDLFAYLRFFDVMVCVPISAQRRNERGYNQSEIAGRSAAKLLQIPFDPAVLKKIRHTKRQSSFRSLPERAANIEGAYAVQKDVKDRKVILFDDIYTTGATVNECSKVLLNAGAKIVVAVCIAVNRSFEKEPEYFQ